MSTASYIDRNGVLWETFQGETLFSDFWAAKVPVVYRDTPGAELTKYATRAGLIDDIEKYAASHVVRAPDPAPAPAPPPATTAPAYTPGAPPAPRVALSSTLLRAFEKLGVRSSTSSAVQAAPSTPGSDPVAPGASSMSSNMSNVATSQKTPLPVVVAPEKSYKNWWIFGGVAAVITALGVTWKMRASK